jgi:hypothetical protein
MPFARKILEMKESMRTEGDADDDDTENDIKEAAATTSAARADTTLSTVAIFVLCMVLNPEVQGKGY